MADALALLALLIGLELVLGVDNVLVIAIFVGRLPVEQRQKARIIGLTPGHGGPHRYVGRGGRSDQCDDTAHLEFVCARFHSPGRRTFSYLQSGHGRIAQTRAQSLHLPSHGICASRGGPADALRAQPPQTTRRHVGLRGAIE